MARTDQKVAGETRATEDAKRTDRSLLKVRQYSDHLVAFYDILGFGQFVRDHSDAEDVHKLFKRITDLSSVDKSLTEGLGQRAIHISDTVIRTTPLRDPQGNPNRFGMLFHEVLDLVHFQMELIWGELLWLRGSLTYGPAFHDENEAYGPAIIRAYELEREVAVYPRVILDPKLLQLFETSEVLLGLDNDRETERGDLLNVLRQGDDGIWFVDYLRAAEAEADEEWMYPEYLKRHKKMILRILGGSTDLNHLTEKYTWLTAYHNETVLSRKQTYYDNFGLSRDNLLITPAEAPLCHTLDR